MKMYNQKRKHIPSLTKKNCCYKTKDKNPILIVSLCQDFLCWVRLESGHKRGQMWSLMLQTEVGAGSSDNKFQKEANSASFSKPRQKTMRDHACACHVVLAGCRDTFQGRLLCECSCPIGHLGVDVPCLRPIECLLLREGTLVRRCLKAH